MTDDPKLTEAQVETRCRIHGGYHFHEDAVARMVAAAEEAARADDLRARVTEAADWCHDRANSHDDDEGADDAYAAAEDYVRWALSTPTRTETGPVAPASPETDPSATPDLLGRNGSIKRCNCEDTRARIEVVVAPWPPGIRKGDVLRAIGEGK